ncbi:MAG: tetratricopeptide repeat protein [Rhodospirillales bacterium]|nr:tetratricopeptide repeat protein [Rhodospirillales bacterium]
MSLILEALKKSEKERQQKSGSGDATAAPENDGQIGPRPRWQWMAVLVALPVLAFVVGGGIGFFRLVPVPQPASDTPRPLATAAPATPAAKQAASTAPIVAAPAHKEPVATAAPPAPPEPAAPTPAPKAVAQPVAPAVPSPAPAATQAESPAATPGRLAAVAVPKKPAAPAATAAASLRPPASGDAQTLTKEGRAFEDKGLYEQAIDAYSQAIVVDPGFADAYFGRGWSRVATGAYGDAARDFASVVALRPDSADAYFGRAWALEQQGDAEQAIRQYGETIRLQPGHAEAYFSRGVLEFTAGRMEAAARDFAAVHENANAGGGLGDYARLWRHVAETRAGDGASATALIGWQGKGPWPEVLAKLFKGEAPPEQVLAAARSENAKKQRENECIAFFFLAQHRLINGDLNGAAGYFRRTLATGVTHFRQYAAARAELGRLGKAN